MLLKALTAIIIALLGALPNAKLTPGSVNPDVTQSNIQATICVSGFTATIRPPSSYTTSLKIKQLQSGYAVGGDYATSDYEEDHLISLELGGAPSDPANLWPEPYFGKNGARVKDKLENRLHDLICSGAISLKTGQRAIAANWQAAYQTYIGPLPDGPDTASSGSVSSNKVVKKTKLDPRFSTCKLANAAGYGPYFKKLNPEYAWYRDANGDGKVC